ncbi:MAG: Uma2 family endonuclease [Gemmatimonas sp.]
MPTDAEAEQTMGMPIAKDRVWTVEDVWALPNDPHHRYEVVDGELLVSPSPRLSHQVAVVALVGLLDDYARAHRIGIAVSAPSDVVLDPKTIVQPDVYVLPLVNGRRVADDDPKPVPLLAVEVLSPSTARFDRLVKRLRYQRAGIEYWVVDLDARLVEHWTPDAARPQICGTALEWWPLGAAARLTIDLVAMFQEIGGDPV